MQRRHELSDEEWAKLAPLLPPRKTAGRYYRDHRQILNAMLYWLHTGVPWRDLPERYGPWETVYSRLAALEPRRALGPHPLELTARARWRGEYRVGTLVH